MKVLLIISCLMVAQFAAAQADQRAKDSMELFAPTPKGELIGEKLSKEIGPNGGELVSEEKGIELIIPAGALSKNTIISLQAATNKSLDGVGNAFDLEPSGIHFNVPVKLILHYDSKNLNGNSPQLLAMVFQDEKGSWFSIGKFKIDTTTKNNIR